MALKGIKVIELAGLAPVPFAGMILSDFGAKVVRVDRTKGINMDLMARGKRSIAVDIKQPEGVNIIKKLCKSSDVIIEPFRPGVMEKLGLGPELLLNDNPRLVYARINGFGQKGMYCNMAGHDINYIATSGILSCFCRTGEKPYPPLNMMADFAGGGLTCAFGIVAALFEREKSGKGQIIDLSMVDGSAYAASFAYITKNVLFSQKPGSNFLDTGAPFYDTYETKDGRHVAVGAIEPQFYKVLIEGLGLKMEELPDQTDTSGWPELRKAIETEIAKYTMSELAAMFDGKDGCLTPVLTPEEAGQHPHNRENETFFKSDDGLFIPNPAPRLSRTAAKADTGGQPVLAGHTREVLLEYGFSSKEIEKFEKGRVIVDKGKSKL